MKLKKNLITIKIIIKKIRINFEKKTNERVDNKNKNQFYKRTKRRKHPKKH
jgi:hypothetical protein